MPEETDEETEEILARTLYGLLKKKVPGAENHLVLLCKDAEAGIPASLRILTLLDQYAFDDATANAGSAK